MQFHLPKKAKEPTPKRGDGCAERFCFESGLTLRYFKEERGDLSGAMKMLVEEHNEKQQRIEDKRQAIKSELLKSVKKLEPSLCMEDGFFNFDSDCETCYDNQTTVEIVLREICMTEERYQKKREKMITAMRRCAASQFLVALQEIKNHDFVALYFFDGTQYFKLTGDKQLPKKLKESAIDMKLVYDPDFKRLISCDGQYPDAAILL